jgi:hypothetical protein
MCTEIFVYELSDLLKATENGEVTAKYIFSNYFTLTYAHLFLVFKNAQTIVSVLIKDYDPTVLIIESYYNQKVRNNQAVRINPEYHSIKNFIICEELSCLLIVCDRSVIYQYGLLGSDEVGRMQKIYYHDKIFYFEKSCYFKHLAFFATDEENIFILNMKDKEIFLAPFKKEKSFVIEMNIYEINKDLLTRSIVLVIACYEADKSCFNMYDISDLFTSSTYD